jgi:hypothetical protein
MILVFILLNLLMIFSAYLAAYRCCKNSSLAELAITTFLFYISQVTLSVLFFGALVKNLAPGNLILLNSFVAAIIILVFRKSLRPALTGSYHKLSGLSKELFKSKDYFLYLFLFLFVFQATATLVKIYYLPPHVGDVFSYHLHPVVEWFQQGQVLSYIDTPIWRANENPLGTKPLHLWFIIFSRDLTWVELPQFLFGFLLSMSGYSIMRKIRVQKRNALRYAILIYFIPAVLLQSRTCQDHLVFAACILLAVHYVIAVFYLERAHAVLPLFLSLGLLFSIKKHAVLVIVVLVFTLLLSRGFKGRRVLDFIKKNPGYLAAAAGLFIAYSAFFLLAKKKLYEQLFSRYSGTFVFYMLLALALAIVLLLLVGRVIKRLYWPGFFRRKPRVITAAVVLVLLCSAGWIIKNRQMLKPFFLGYPSPLISTNRNFAVDYPAFNNNFMKNLLAFPFRLKDLGLYTVYTPDLLDKSGFGVQFFAFGLIAYAFAAAQWLFKKSFRDSITGFLLLFAVLLLAVYFAVYFSWANYRSFIFFAVIAIMLWSFMTEKQGMKTYHLVLLDCLMVVMIVFNGVVCFFEGNMSARQWKTLLTLDNPADRTSTKYSPLLGTSKDNETWDFIDRFMAADQPIGYLAGGAAWTFPYFDNRAKRRIYYLKSLPGFATVPEPTKGIVYHRLEFTPEFKTGLILRGIHFLHINNHGVPRRRKIVVPGDNTAIVKVTQSLYYVKW